MPMLTTARTGRPVCPSHAPERTASAKPAHPVEHRVDVGHHVAAVHDQRRPARHPQRDVERGPVLGDVDRLAPEHRLDPRRQPAGLGKPDEELDASRP